MTCSINIYYFLVSLCQFLLIPNTLIMVRCALLNTLHLLLPGEESKILMTLTLIFIICTFSCNHACQLGMLTPFLPFIIPSSLSLFYWNLMEPPAGDTCPGSVFECFFLMAYTIYFNVLLTDLITESSLCPSNVLEQNIAWA